MKYAVVPLEVWRDLFHKKAEDILAELTSAGSDPEKVTTAMGHVNDYNTVRAQIEIIEK